MSYINTSLYNLSLSKRNVVISRNGEVNRVMQYLGGDSILYKNYYIQNENNLENSGIISCNDKTLKFESNKIVFSGNISLRGENLSISGSLNMTCNSIIGLSGISFCEDGSIGSGLDLKTNGILTLQGVENSSIVSKNRIYQDINYEIFNGYYELTKNSFTDTNTTNGKKATDRWNLINTSLVSSTSLRSICWSPELSIFCTVSFGGASKVLISADGINWNAFDCPSSSWFSICWANNCPNGSGTGIFCAVSNSGPIMTSPDGKNWTLRTIPQASPGVNSNWYSVCWSSELKLFCVVDSSPLSTNYKVMTSPNGIEWNLTLLPINSSLFSVAWSPELSLFCAVGANGTVITSPDGINWTLREAPLLLYSSVCWSSQLRLFCAVSSSGVSNNVIISYDGVQWINIITPSSIPWFNICWSPDLKIFCAISNSTTGNLIQISQDGINWELQPSPSNSLWRILCWSPELSIFCGVTNSSGGRVMTSSFKGRIPTSYNVFDSPFNNIDQNGNWTIQQVLKRGVYTSGDETPSVLGANLLYISNTSLTPITNFTNPSTNQEIVLVFFDSNTTIENNENIKLRGGANFTSTSNDTLTLLYTGTLWVEISRSINP